MFRTVVLQTLRKTLGYTTSIRLINSYRLSYPFLQALSKEKQCNRAQHFRQYTTSLESTTDPNTLVDSVTYERACSETLESLSEYFEDLTERADNLEGSDVAYSDGVLTINLGSKYGTYVINRQTPNRQIWLSSPTSGPKRYDYVATDSPDGGRWIYRHTGESMHELLQNEIGNIIKTQSVDFIQLPYGA